MDILQSKNNNNETKQTRPIFLIVLLVLLVAFAAYWYSKKNPSLLPSNLIKQPGLVSLNKSIEIDFGFLRSPEFQALEQFPDYPAFRPATGNEVTPGRVNPFIPPTAGSTKKR
jgi:hypothetical protein